MTYFLLATAPFEASTAITILIMIKLIAMIVVRVIQLQDVEARDSESQ